MMLEFIGAQSVDVIMVSNQTVSAKALKTYRPSSIREENQLEDPSERCAPEVTYRIRRGPLLRNPENFTLPSDKHGQRFDDINSPEPTARTESQTMSARLISQEKRLVLLVMFPIFASFCCFGTVYYLFTTSRWASVSSGMAGLSLIKLELHLTITMIPSLTYPCLTHIPSGLISLFTVGPYSNGPTKSSSSA